MLKRVKRSSAIVANGFATALQTLAAQNILQSAYRPFLLTPLIATATETKVVMDIQLVLDWLLDLYAEFPIPFYLTAGILFALTLWQPVKMLKRALLFLVLLAVIYVCFYLLGSMMSGVDVKQKASSRTIEQIEK